ncbi:MAG: hypothetical protein CVU38_00100 [Chloroflexi bacterium HGW-Chloroflexi-1]|nr:MAG: hypothetical protein CVU38_00100 [Chloroflexi bacterium HGW-Chloroflexi-1]
MYRYDASERPPAAILTVQVTNPVSGRKVLLVGKLDTGAGISVLPQATVKGLGLISKSDV